MTTEFHEQKSNQVKTAGTKPACGKWGEREMVEKEKYSCSYN